MCKLVVKIYKDGKPLRAKSHIAVLGNPKNRLYHKSQRYAHVLKYNYLRLLTAKSIGEKTVLQQGGFKNVFYNAHLPDDEFTVIYSPIGKPYFQEDKYWLLNKNLYGICRSPHHWYNTIKGILLKMGTNPSTHNPFLIYGTLNNPYSSTFTPHLQ